MFEHSYSNSGIFCDLMFNLKYILKQGFLSEKTCIFAYKKTLKQNNNGSHFKVYSDVCVAQNS